MQTTGSITSNFAGCAFDCMAGTYGASTDLTMPDQCTACPEGTSSVAGASSKDMCTCPVLRYWATPDECAICPEGKSSFATDANECTCPAGSFDEVSSGANSSSSSCVECPLAGEATDCLNAGAGVTLATLPVMPNFWRISPISTAIGPCYTTGVCIGASAAQGRASNASNARLLQTAMSASLPASASTYGNGLCRLGHTGPFCEQCATSYYKDPSGICNDCKESSGNVSLTLALPIAMVAIALLIGLLLACRGRNTAIAIAVSKLESDSRGEGATFDIQQGQGTAKETAATLIRGKIVLSLFQVITQMRHVFEIRFPVFFATILRWLSLVQLDLFTLMPLACLFPTDFHTTLLLRTLIPLGVISILSLAGALALRKSEACTGARPKASYEWLGNLLITLVFVRAAPHF